MRLSNIVAFFCFLLPTSASALHLASPSAGVDMDTKKITRIQGEIDAMSLSSFLSDVLRTGDLPGDRIILIDSPGGITQVGDVMIAAMEAERAMGVRQVCVVLGEASSMAFNLLSHCDVRLAVKEARFMAHKIYFPALPPKVRLNAKNLHKLADQLDKDDEGYRQANARAMHLTLKEYDKAADADKEYTTEQLRKMDYLQGVVKVRK